MGIQKVKMSEAISAEDLIDPEQVELVRNGLVAKFFDTYPEAQKVHISVSTNAGLDKDSVVFTVEGIVK